MSVLAQEWSADAVAPAQRPDAVREALGATHLPWELAFDDRPVTCDLSSHEVADAALVECRSGPVRGWRPPARGVRDEVHVGVLVVLDGRERVRQDDVVVDLRAGDALVWRSDRPASFEVVEPLHKVTLLLAADRVVGPVGPVALPAGRAATGLLSAHLRTLAGVADRLSAVDAGFVVDVALDLVARAARGPDAGGDGGALAAVRRRAVEVVEAELEDPLLSPASLADRLGVSTRWLHQAFADSGETVAGLVRRRRLERVRRDLADPTLARVTVTTLAFRHGFTDGPTLSRQFRAAYGTTPSAYRRDRVG